MASAGLGASRRCAWWDSGCRLRWGSSTRREGGRYARFGDKLPAELAKQLDALEERLASAGG